MSHLREPLQSTDEGVATDHRSSNRSSLTSRGERRRQEIVEAAATLFDQLGYHNTSMAAIAESVDTAKATIYHYFKAKHDILFEIHDLWINGLIDLFESRAAVATPLDQIRGVFDDIFYLMDTKPSHIRVFFEYIREFPPDLYSRASEDRDRYQNLVENAITEAIHRGDLHEQNAQTTAFALFGMCNWAYQWYQPDGHYSHTELAAKFFNIFMVGTSRCHNDSGADAAGKNSLRSQ